MARRGCLNISFDMNYFLWLRNLKTYTFETGKVISYLNLIIIENKDLNLIIIENQRKRL